MSSDAAMLHDAAVLDAGGVLPAGAAPGEESTDVLTARAYRHPVLGDQVVVRLVPEKVGEAEDLTMEFLGFDRPQSAAPVGIVRQQALGFAGWVLVNDPANAHHALAVVKEIERLTRVAKSRIGPAKDGFVAIGDKLAASVPSFLPSFYEDAARAFLAADSPTYAAAMFGKAREAEKSYGLVIDSDRQHAAFLEFALAGALTAKALTAHARDLAQRCAPEDAYDRFYRLCTERVLGGLPPYAGMHTDLRRLAKAAGHGQQADERLIEDLRGAASLMRAPGAFWTAYRATLARLAQRDPAVRGWLLSFMPKDCPHDVWLAILEESGATAALTSPAGTGPAEAEPADGPAGWLGRFDRHRGRWGRTRLAALYALAEQMAVRLKADGTPVRLCRENEMVDLDLVDLCLALGVPLEDTGQQGHFGVEYWLEDEKPGRRDLVALAADERMLPRLAASIERDVRPYWSAKPAPQSLKVRAVVAVPGLRMALHWWLDRIAAGLARGGIPALNGKLDRVAWFASPEGLAVNPEAVRCIGDHDVVPLLGRTLRAGVFDEYHWPGLEQAAARLEVPDLRAPSQHDDEFDDDDDDKEKGEEDKVRFRTQWPYLVVCMPDQAAVVGTTVEYEHRLRIPPGTKHGDNCDLRYADGQLLVSWGGWGDPASAYWSGAAGDVFTIDQEWHDRHLLASIALPDGGRTAGDWPLRAGDRAVRWRGRVMSDGHTYWTWAATGDDEAAWHEYDPATGKLGRPSLPAFIEDGAVDGEPLLLEHCRLIPAPAELADSPLGSHDGLIGWRVRRTSDGGRAGVAADGRSFVLPGPVWAAFPAGGDDSTLLGAIRFPGSDTVYGIVRTDRYRAEYHTVCASDGFELARFGVSERPGGYCAGTRYLMPPASAYWNYLRIRDEAGSVALRACTDEVARSLLDGALRGGARAVAPLIRELLPAVGDDGLAAGIAGVVRQAAISARRLAKFRALVAGQPLERQEQVDPAETAAEAAGFPSDSGLYDAIGDLLPSWCPQRGYSAVRMFTQAGALLTAPELDQAAARSLPEADEDWWPALAALRAAAYRAVSPATPPARRDALLGWLEACAGSGLMTPGSRLRVVQMFPDEGQPPAKRTDFIGVGARRVLVLTWNERDGETWAVDYAPDGVFGAVPGFRVTSQVVYDNFGLSQETLLAFVSLARQKGPLPWQPDLPAALSAGAGLSLAEATIVLAGLLDRKTWEQSAQEDWRAAVSVTDEAIVHARSTWHNLPLPVRVGALGRLLPDDFAALWESGPAAERLATWLTEYRGARTPVDDALIIDAAKAHINVRMNESELLHGIVNAGTCRWLHGRVTGVADEAVMESVVRAILWAADALPGDHPVRRALPAALELARARLADPEVSFQGGGLYQEDVPGIFASFGLPVISDENWTTARHFGSGPTAGPRCMCTPRCCRAQMTRCSPCCACGAASCSYRCWPGCGCC